jgi:hypothetical protein
MALGSTQPLNRNEYQEYFMGVGLTNLPSSCADVLKSGSLNPQGLSRPVMGLVYLLPYESTREYASKCQCPVQFMQNYNVTP